MTASALGHWDRVAARWDAVGAPLRPSPADVDIVVSLARALPAGRRRTLVLGATRELAAAPWPPDTELLALDRSEPMLRALWPGPAGSALLGDWRAMPFARASVDLAVCDGGWHLLARGPDQDRLVDELARIVAPAGSLAVRLFEPSAGAVTVEDVLALMGTGAISDANHLKLLLWMVVRDEQGAVAVADVWSTLAALWPDLDVLAERLSWPAATLHAFDSYRDSPDRYHLLDVDELERQLSGTGAFEIDAVHAGAQLVPDLRFPTLVLRRLG